ncbi:MAG TPA: ADOP family duplicated permease [Thermoanaerobaculia bacterium]|nr:ADOP family duplicated permease [Thermoanaerobaculia bacterium]
MVAERDGERPRPAVRFDQESTEAADETGFHLERLAEDLVAGGASPEEARREAERRFGDRAAYEREVAGLRRRRRARERWRALGWTVGDALRRAGRTLLRERGLSALVIGCLALGTGGPAAIFLLIEALLLEPLPGIERQAELWKVDLEGNASFPSYDSLREAGIFESVAAYSDTLLSVRRGERVERALALTVTGSYFPVLGTRAAAGRMLEPSDDRAGAAPVVVVGRSFAERTFGGAASALGQTLHVNGAPFEVVGVAPPRFVGTFVGFQFDLWVPFEWIRVTEPGSDPTRRDRDLVEVAARLRAGSSREQVAAELRRLELALRAEHPADFEDVRFELRRTTGIDPDLYGTASSVLALLLGASLVLTLLACAPVVNVLLARAIRRTPELAVRRVLGAGRAQVATLLLGETLMLALLGGLLGVIAGSAAARALWALEPPLPVALSIDLSPGWRVAVFGGGLGAVVGVLLGLLQSARAPAASLATTLRCGTPGGGRRGRSRHILIAAQLALSALLLLVAALFVRSMLRSSSMDPGFAVDSLRVLPRVDLALAPDALEPSRVFAQLLERLEALPGVDGASAISRLPLELFGSSDARIRVEGRDPLPEAQRPEVDFAIVEHRFLEVAQVSLLSGRSFGVGDSAEADAVAVISRAMAEAIWPDGEPLGARFAIDETWITVIGVAADVMVRRYGEAPRPFAYLPLAQRPTPRMTVVLRGPAPPASLAAPVRGIFRELAADLPPPEPLAAREYLAISLLPQRLVAWVAGTLGFVGLLLAAAGVYGVTAYAVSMRHRELAVRASLGASPAELRRLVLGEGLRVAVVGLGIGLGGGMGLAMLLRSLLVGVGPLDPPTYLTIGAGLLVVVLLATLGPARRAAGASPVADLRAE